MSLIPLDDCILVQPVEEEEQKTTGGIIVPDTAKEKPQEAKVIAVGQGRFLDNGERQPIGVATGDKVIFGKYSGTEIKYDGVEYLILRSDDVLAKIG